MTPRPLTCALGMVLALTLAGCPTTEAPADPVIPVALAAQTSTAALMAATVAGELALNVAEPPGLGGCPAGTVDGDVLTLTWGAGCVPDSGITAELVTGQAELTVASGSGYFVGDVAGLGFVDLPLIGEVSGTTSRAGPLLSADVQFAGLTWTENGSEVTFDGLFEVAADADGFVLNASSAAFFPGWEPEVELDLVEVTAVRGALGACFVPDGGTIQLERDGYEAALAYSPGVAETGTVTVTFEDRDPETYSPCP